VESVNLPAVVAALRQLAAAIEADVAPAPAAGVLTVAQVAAQLHRSSSTVRGWCEAERLAGAFKLNGRDWRIPAIAVDDFIAGQRRPETSRDVTRGAMIGVHADTGVPRRRARRGDGADLGAWRRERAE
jgi:excisionase family DNA binding protein